MKFNICGYSIEIHGITSPHHEKLAFIYKPYHKTTFSPLPDQKLTIRLFKTFEGYLLKGPYGEIVCNEQEVVPLIVQQINFRMLTENRRFLALHAAALKTSNGSVIIFPGSTGSGKSTLTLYLVSIGMSFLSDEAVFVTPNSYCMIPYSRAISHEKPDSLPFDISGLKKLQVGDLISYFRPEKEDLMNYHKVIPIRYIIFLSKGNRCDFFPLSKKELLKELSQHVFNVRQRNIWFMETIFKITEHIQAYKLTWNKIDHLISYLSDISFEDFTR